MNFSLILSIIFLYFINDIETIPCDFQYIEHNDPTEYELERLDLELEKHSNDSPSYESFSCEEDSYLDPHSSEDEPVRERRDLSQSVKEEKSESHEYEEIETSCSTIKRTIQPKALNNIYNKLTKVVNTESFVQSIHIEECLNTKEPCNQGVIAPQIDQKYICRQKFVRIALKALSKANAVFDDFFYYPSHCVCELVKVKKKIKEPKITKKSFFT